MRQLVLFVVALCLCACDPKETSTTSPSGPSDKDNEVSGDRPRPKGPGPGPSAEPDGGAFAYPAGAWGPVRDATARGVAQEGITTVARPLISKLTDVDPVALAVRFETEDKALAQGRVDWSATVGAARFHVALDGRTEVLELAAKPTVSDVSPLVWRPFVLSLTPGGLKQHATVTPWKNAPTALGKTGKLSIHVEGTLALDGKTIPFASLPVTVEVVEPGDLLPLAAVEGIASRFVARAEQLSRPPATLSPPIDDEQHNRLFRFRNDERPSMNHLHLIDLVMSPKGALIAGRAFAHFQCVAEGTAIATPAGDVPVEHLAVGDEVLAYDVERRRPVTARVSAITDALRRDLVAVGPLRVTGEHPIWADGRWVNAEDLAPGATLLSASLAPLELARIERLPSKPTRVFDLSVTWPHDYFAAGVLVHNKSAHVPLGTDAWRGLFSRQPAK